MTFLSKLTTRLDTIDSQVCVGLDSEFDRLPPNYKRIGSKGEAIFRFNQDVIEQTHDLAVAYKCNLSSYASYGTEGLEALARTTKWLRKYHAHIPLLADTKRSDMGDSWREIFVWMGFDAMMVTPWFGRDTVVPYLRDEERGVVVYVHDSNPSASEIQDLPLLDGRLLYEHVAHLASTAWNTTGNVIVEVGATYPLALQKTRRIVGEDMPIVTAGIGAQGGHIKDLLGAFGKGGRRLLVNSSRGILFPTTETWSLVAVRKAAQTLQETLWKASQKGKV